MNLWLYLALSLWVLAIGTYIIKNQNYTIFSFFDGLLLAFLCFKFLPETFLQGNFWLAVVGLLLGALIGSLGEEYGKTQTAFHSPLWHSSIFSLAILLFFMLTKAEGSYGSLAIFLLILLGGCFLSVSCSGILPEGDNTKEKAMAGFLAAAGFMIGTWHLYI